MSLRTDLRAVALTKKYAATKKWIDLDHYLLAAYASTEAWTQQTVVVDPRETEPTWLLRPRARKANRHSTLALLLPSLRHLTLDLAQAHTSIGTDYIGLRVHTREHRRAGLIRPHESLLVAEKFTDDGPVFLPHAAALREAA